MRLHGIRHNVLFFRKKILHKTCYPTVQEGNEENVKFNQCTNDMTFFISADTDNHRYNPIFISADTDKLPIQFFLYRPIPIPITDITIFIIYTFFIMIARKIILKLLPLCQLVVDPTREKNYPFVFCTLDFYILQNKVKQCSISS